MKEYQFKYTNSFGPLVVMLITILTFILAEFSGIYLQLNILLTIALSLGLAILIFQLLKGKAVFTCKALLSDISVSFEFENKSKIINFNDLVSYKVYYGKNGPVLYLKSNIDNFKIYSNNNFCKTDDFRLFCEEAIIQLDNYKDKSDSILIHEGSIFGTKGMKIFMIISTIIYLLAFFIETETLRIYVGFGGGFYLMILWLKYIIERKKETQ